MAGGAGRRIWNTYLRIQQVVSASLLLFTVVVTLVNVTMRYVLAQSIVWADEAARAGFIWLTFLGAALAVAGKAHLAIDTVVEMVPTPVRRVLVGLGNLGALAFFALLLIGGYEQVVDNLGQLSPALRIPLGYVYAVVPISAVLMAVNLVGARVFGTPELAEGAPGPESDLEQAKELV